MDLIDYDFSIHNIDIKFNTKIISTMKRLLPIFLFSILISGKISAQITDWPVPYNKEDEMIIYEEVVQMPGITKDDLFDRAMKWLDGYMVNVSAKIYEKDKSAGSIKLNYYSQLYKTVKKDRLKDVLVKFKIELYFKEGRYKYKILDFHTARGSIKTPLEKWMSPNEDQELSMSRFTQLNENIEKLIFDLKKGINDSGDEEEDDW